MYSIYASIVISFMELLQAALTKIKHLKFNPPISLTVKHQIQK